LPVEPSPAKPAAPRTWRPMVLWSAAILLLLGLVWMVSVTAVPYCRMRALAPELPFDRIAPETMVQKLGGPEGAALVAGQYLQLPGQAATDRHRAICLLASCGEPGIPALVAALHDKDVAVRQQSTWALGWIGRGERGAVPALLGALDDEDRLVGVGAALALVKMGREAEVAIRKLKEAMTDGNRDVRQSAIEGAGDRGPAAIEVVPTLCTVLVTDKDDEIRWQAALALKGIGPAAIKAVPALETAAANDTDESVRAAAAEALKKIRGEEPPK